MLMVPGGSTLAGKAESFSLSVKVASRAWAATMRRRHTASLADETAARSQCIPEGSRVLLSVAPRGMAKVMMPELSSLSV